MEIEMKPLYGLVLAGGKSRRLDRDKRELNIHGKPQVFHCYELLNAFCEKTFVSQKKDQSTLPEIKNHYIYDEAPYLDIGPLGGIMAAMNHYPAASWMVTAVDLPFLNNKTLEHLMGNRNIHKAATAYISSVDGLPEPLCAIWESHAQASIKEWIKASHICPRKFLMQNNCHLIELHDKKALTNINTPDDYQKLLTKKIKIHYYAILKDQRGLSDEEVETKAKTAQDLYEEIMQKHQLTLGKEMVKVAINDEYSPWTQNLADGDSVTYIPPVGGGGGAGIPLICKNHFNYIMIRMTDPEILHRNYIKSYQEYSIKYGFPIY